MANVTLRGVRKASAGWRSSTASIWISKTTS